MPTREGPRRTRRWTTLGAALSVGFGVAVATAPSAAAQAPAPPAPIAVSGLLGGIGDLLDGVLSPLGDALETLLGHDPAEEDVTPLEAWLEDLDEGPRVAAIDAIDQLAEDGDVDDTADALTVALDEAALADLVAEDGPLDALADADATGLVDDLVAQLREVLDAGADPGEGTGGAPDGTDAPDDGAERDATAGSPATDDAPRADADAGSSRTAGETATDAPTADGTTPSEAPATDDASSSADGEGTTFAPRFAPREDLDLEAALDTSVVEPGGLAPFAAGPLDGAPGATGQPPAPEVERDDEVPGATRPDLDAPVAPEPGRERSPITAANATAAGEDRTAPLIAAAAALTLATSMLVWQARRPTGRGAPG